MRLLERRFAVAAPLEKAWAHLEKVEAWPSWARHIKKIELRPSGPLQPGTEGKIFLTNGVRSTFRMTELNPGANWKWSGPFLWIDVDYDHRFTRTGPTRPRSPSCSTETASARRCSAGSSRRSTP